MALRITVLCLHITYYLANGILFIEQYFQIKITNNLQRVQYNTRGMEHSGL